MTLNFYGRLFLVATFTLFSGLTLAQKTHEVHLNIMPVEGRTIPEFFFQPTGLFVEPNDTVRFVADSLTTQRRPITPNTSSLSEYPKASSPFPARLFRWAEAGTTRLLNPASTISGAGHTSSTGWR